MRRRSQLLHCLSLFVGILLMLTGCTYMATGELLSPVEWEELSPERHMPPVPSAPTAAEKAATVRQATASGEIGLTPRLPALEAREQEAVHNGVLYPRMSADALRLTWGEPFYTSGRPNYSEHWYYLSPSLDLTPTAHPPVANETQVDVYLEHGHVLAWADVVPTGTTNGAGERILR